MGQQNAAAKFNSENGFWKIARVVWAISRSIFNAIRFKTIPIDKLLFTSSSLFIGSAIGLDIFVFRLLAIAEFYPSTILGRGLKSTVVGVTPFVFWAIYEGVRLIRFEREISETLTIAGLRNVFGDTPKIVGIFPIDQETKKLVLNKASFSLNDFLNAKPRIESGLKSFVDEIKESRIKGTVEILYSNLNLPSSVIYNEVQRPNKTSFFVGKTRAKDIFGTLDSTPHLLVAGQTGGGKSTFLRNLITTLFLNCRNMKFTLIDLKGGLEFQLFEDLPRVDVIPSIERAIEELSAIQKELVRRFELLKMHKVKDVAHLDTSAKEFSFLSSRRVIVVDEAAELFLAGGGADSTKIIQARRILSLIARQGRAVGINLIIGTQRPDSKSLDPQVKANLTGALCFPMQNDSSSITVLGNGRATDLPLIPGRAIWKEGPVMTEVQTPFLSIEEADRLLETERTQKSSEAN